MKKPLILIGGGGHCKSCIDVIEAEGKYTIEGIIDTRDKVGSYVLNYPIIDDDSNLDKYIKRGAAFLVTIGQIKSNHIRKSLYELLKIRSALIATIISPTAVVSKYALIGEGTILMNGVYVNAGATIGNNVILNTGCLIEHDVSIGDNVHVSTQAVLNGAVTIEDDCFIGSNAIVVNGIRVNGNVIVGAGSVVTKNLTTAGIYIGNPAKMLNKIL